MGTRRFNLAIALILLLVCATPFALLSMVDSTLTTTVNVVSSTVLSFENFTSDTSSITEGGTISFSLQFRNIGNNVINAQPQTLIYGANSTLIANLTYVNFTLAGGESVTIEKQWPSTGVAAGNYIAYANGTYSILTTSTKNVSFTITTTPSQAPAQQQGGSPYAPKEKELKPQKKPPEGKLPPPGSGSSSAGGASFLRYPLVQEVQAGTNSLISVLLENPTSENMKVLLSPSGSAAQLLGSITDMLLPNEKKTILLPVSIPKDAQAGYYLLSLGTNEQLGDAVSIIFKVNPNKEKQKLQVNRELLFNPKSGDITVNLKITNNADKTIENAQIYEQLPDKALPAIGSIKFSTLPTKIDKTGSLQWGFSSLLPYETRIISYNLPASDYEMAQLSNWPILQTEIIERSRKNPVSITDVIIEGGSLESGENITIRIFNSDFESKQVSLQLLPSTGWEFRPSYMEFTLSPRVEQDIKSLVYIEPYASLGSYPLTIILSYDDTTEEKIIYINAGLREVPPSATQLSPAEYASMFILENYAYIAGAAVILLLAFGIIKYAFAWLTGSKFNSSRLEYMQKINNIFSEEKE